MLKPKQLFIIIYKQTITSCSITERQCHGSVKMTVSERWVWCRLNDSPGRCRPL